MSIDKSSEELADLKNVCHEHWLRHQELLKGVEDISAFNVERVLRIQSGINMMIDEECIESLEAGDIKTVALGLRDKACELVPTPEATQKYLSFLDAVIPDFNDILVRVSLDEYYVEASVAIAKTKQLEAKYGAAKKQSVEVKPPTPSTEQLHKIRTEKGKTEQLRKELEADDKELAAMKSKSVAANPPIEVSPATQEELDKNTWQKVLDVEIDGLFSDIRTKLGIGENPNPDQLSILTKLEVTLDARVDLWMAEHLSKEAHKVYEKMKSDNPDTKNLYINFDHEIQMVSEQVHEVKKEFLNSVLASMV